MSNYVVVRIVGNCKTDKKALETLNRLNLRRKFSCVLIDKDDKVLVGMIKSVQDYIAYDEISEELEKTLNEKRGKDGKKVFCLHPPRGGFKKSSKLPYPKGILRRNKDLDKMLERML